MHFARLAQMKHACRLRAVEPEGEAGGVLGDLFSTEADLQAHYPTRAKSAFQIPVSRIRSWIRTVIRWVIVMLKRIVPL